MIGTLSSTPQMLVDTKGSVSDPGHEDAAASRVVSPATPNPKIRLDGVLGLIVIEFLDAVGEVAASLPTPRQIKAYRTALLSSGGLIPPDALSAAPHSAFGSMPGNLGSLADATPPATVSDSA